MRKGRNRDEYSHAVFAQWVMLATVNQPQLERETERQREHSMTRQVKGSSQALWCSKMSLPADADLARGNNNSTVGSG